MKLLLCLKSLPLVLMVQSYYNARGLFVRLFVCLFVSYTNRHHYEVHPETCHAHWGAPGGVFREPASDCLPCGRRTCKVLLSRGTETPFVIDIMRSPVAGRNALKHSKMREARGLCSQGTGVRLYTCPVAAKIAPDILGLRTQTPVYFLFGIMQIPLAFQAVQNGLAECFTPVDTL